MSQRFLPIMSATTKSLVPDAGRVTQARTFFPDEPLEAGQMLSGPDLEAEIGWCEQRAIGSSQVSKIGHKLAKMVDRRAEDVRYAGYVLQALLEVERKTESADVSKAVWIVANKVQSVSGAHVQLHSRCRRILDAYSKQRNSAHLCAAWQLMSPRWREHAILAGTGTGGRQFQYWLNLSDWFLVQFEKSGVRSAKNNTAQFQPWRIPEPFAAAPDFRDVEPMSDETFAILSRYTVRGFRGE